MRNKTASGRVSFHSKLERILRFLGSSGTAEFWFWWVRTNLHTQAQRQTFFFFFLILHKPKVFPRNYDVSSDEAGLARCPCSRRLVFLIVKCLSGAANPRGLYQPSVPVACCTDPSCQVPQSLHSPAWAQQAMATMVPVKLQSFFILLALCSRTLRAMNGSQQHCL